MSDPSDRERPGREDGLSDMAAAYQKAAPFMAASMQLVGSVGLLAALGYWGDRKLGHRVPWMLLLGAAVGMTGGFIAFFRTVLKK